MWGNQDNEDTYDTVKLALDRGINFVDNAEVYGDWYTEEVFERALNASGYDKSQYVVATKVYRPPEIMFGIS